MSKWGKVKLGDIYRITSGGTPSKAHPEYYENGIVPWVKTGDLKDKYVGQNIDRISSEGLRNSSAKLFPVGTVLIAMYGATIGACSILAFEASSNQACAAFLPVEDMDNTYLYYFLCSQKNNFIKMGVGGAQPNISATILKSVKIPLPPLEEQRRIAQTLDAAAELLRLRKQQLAELDALIKNRFIEMFGDPVTNPMGWEVKKISDFSNVKIGPFGSLLHVEDYIEDGCPLINPSHICNGELVPDRKLTLTFDKYSELKSYQMKENDLVLGRRGEIGRCAVVKEAGFLCGTGSMFIRVKECCNPDYLQKIISFPTFKAQLEDKAVGVTMKNLNAGTVANSKVPVPPLCLQNQFADFVHKVEASKSIVQQSIDENQALFDSLMSEFFE